MSDRMDIDKEKTIDTSYGRENEGYRNYAYSDQLPPENPMGNPPSPEGKENAYEKSADERLSWDYMPPDKESPPANPVLLLGAIGVIAACPGIFLVRCANFVNGELWGKETDLPWGVMFSPNDVYRHPSQLYEAFLEGACMFIILWVLSKKMPPRPQMTFTGVFLAWYGICRILIEFVRVPDQQVGYLFGGFVTMGQCLSLPLLVGGVYLIWWAHVHNYPQVAYTDGRVVSETTEEGEDL